MIKMNIKKILERNREELSKNINQRETSRPVINIFLSLKIYFPRRFFSVVYPDDFSLSRSMEASFAHYLKYVYTFTLASRHVALTNDEIK